MQWAIALVSLVKATGTTRTNSFLDVTLAANASQRHLSFHICNGRLRNCEKLNGTETGGSQLLHEQGHPQGSSKVFFWRQGLWMAPHWGVTDGGCWETIAVVGVTDRGWQVTEGCWRVPLSILFRQCNGGIFPPLLMDGPVHQRRAPQTRGMENPPLGSWAPVWSAHWPALPPKPARNMWSRILGARRGAVGAGIGLPPPFEGL